ncbi:MAG TPA: secondary thiamine-phosphate synthase enzyme YjbQ [Candidatus Polarisedimenticolia bacterium]|nr:secondary thiamine-phosphate synthase enzyme YjbQ [Candidatus Polarisedimenticolia bacterium]
MVRIHQARVRVKTTGRIVVENVTTVVAGAVTDAGVARGIAVVSVAHTTCGLAINEDEAGLREDIRRVAGALLSPIAAQRPFEHDCVDDNAQAHLTSILLGHSVTIPVADSRLVLGTWQSIFLIEMDGPRERYLDIQVIGE